MTSICFPDRGTDWVNKHGFTSTIHRGFHRSPMIQMSCWIYYAFESGPSDPAPSSDACQGLRKTMGYFMFPSSDSDRYVRLK